MKKINISEVIHMIENHEYYIHELPKIIQEKKIEIEKAKHESYAEASYGSISYEYTGKPSDHVDLINKVLKHQSIVDSRIKSLVQEFEILKAQQIEAIKVFELFLKHSFEDRQNVMKTYYIKTPRSIEDKERAKCVVSKLVNEYNLLITRIYIKISA